MRILLMQDIGSATGGAEIQLLALREGLRARGHEVRLMSSRVHRVPGFPVLADYTCFGTDTKLQVLSQTFNPDAYLTLRRVLNTFRPDVVHVRLFLWQLSPTILPLLRSVPSVYQAAMYKPICPLGTKQLPDGTPCTTPAGRVCLDQCLTPQTWAVLMLQLQLWKVWRDAFRATVVLSTAMKARMEADPLCPVTPLEIIHNGVPERPMRPPLAGPPRVMYAGRLVPEKGIDVLMRAFAPVSQQLPTAELHIAGMGPEEEPLRALADQLGIQDQVHWLGYLSRADLEAHFDQAWVQAVPSQWEEPFGNVGTEAHMRGTALVASRVGGQIDIVDEGTTGFLISPTDEAGWTQALLHLLSNRERAEAMGQAGRQRALAHFSEDRCVERFLALYERIQHTPVTHA
ncbi:MAG: glycosyltransferase family 4 protein [Bacteroidota bacterium]